MIHDIIEKTALDRERLKEECAKYNAFTHGQVGTSNLLNELRELAASKFMRLASNFQSSVQMRKKYYYVGRRSSLRSG